MQKFNYLTGSLEAMLWIDCGDKCGWDSCNNLAVIQTRADDGLDQSDSWGGGVK